MTQPGFASGYPSVGEVVDSKYRVEELIGQGGMGAVARATHLVRKAPVALKFMSADVLLVPGAVERFINEAVAASQIDSDHIVRIFDTGTLPNGAPYLVMELLVGIDLSQLIAREGQGGLVVPRAVHLVLQMLRALQIDVARRLESMLAGDYRSKRHGPGTELAQVRPYAPGDDVRLIEWNVTARTGEPHVRVNLAERVLVTWLVLDTSPSMQFGTAERRKADVAAGVAIGVGHVATRRGNRLGIVTFGDSHPQAIPPTAGRHGLLGLLAALGRDPEEQPVGATSLGRALDTAGAIARQRGIVVLVSDFRGPLDWRTPLLRVLDRHDVLAVEIRDPREQELPNVGELWLLDPETGRQIRVDTRDARLRDRFAAAAAEERTGVARVLAALGVPHLVLSTSGDWLRPFAVFLGARR